MDERASLYGHSDIDLQRGCARPGVQQSFTSDDATELISLLCTRAPNDA